jgi:NADH-quinone oxidoreductase subunit F
MIVQKLAEIQEEHGYLPAEQLQELAKDLGEPLHRLHEVASFFPLYKLKEGPKVDVRICRDIACHLKGSKRMIESLKGLADQIDPSGRTVGVEGVSCLGQCDHAIAAVINEEVFPGIAESDLRRKIQDAISDKPVHHVHADRSPLGWKIDPYDGDPRYEGIRKLIDTRDPKTGALNGIDALLKELKDSTLSGMGGARFPTHMKWDAVRKEKAEQKYVVCNGDECEPGTFKDRELLRRAPHLLVEGMVLAGLTVGGTRGYIYIRHEYHDEIEAVKEAIEDATHRGFCGQNILGSGHSFPVEVFTSPGGYICGEETALLEAMEDRRAEPRNKPPFPTVKGLYDMPTIINNVETLMWAPVIWLKGGAWYAGQGVNGGTGLWFCSISGDVNNPGVYEVPFGLTVRDLIFKRAGGMSGGQRLKAIGTSGPSGGFIPVSISRDRLSPGFAKERMAAVAKFYDVLDLPLDYKLLAESNPRSPGAMGTRPLQYMLGAAFVAVGDKANMLDLSLNLTEFFKNESCGKCVPCRVGSQKLVDILTTTQAQGATAKQIAEGQELGHVMVATSICGLGQVAPNPLLSLMEHFSQEVDAVLQPDTRTKTMIQTAETRTMRTSR